MSVLARRDLLAALLAVTAGGGLPTLARAAADSPFQDLDIAAVERIGRAWLDAHPDSTAPALARRLFPGGQNAGTLAALRRQIVADFRHGEFFTHRGWRLAQTEGALFGLLALGNTQGAGR